MNDFGYVVAEINQASLLVEVIHGPFWTLQEAEEVASDLREDTRRAGRNERYYVADLEPLGDPS